MQYTCNVLCPYFNKNAWYYKTMEYNQITRQVNKLPTSYTKLTKKYEHCFKSLIKVQGRYYA